MAHLLPVQRDYIAKQAEGKNEADKTAAKEVDKKAHAELNALRARACNAECFDCSAKKPGWAVLPHGVFICIDCAQVHRNMGRHISQTKAINTGTYLWFPHELAVMRAVGNGVAARAYGADAMAAKPSRDAAPESKDLYTRRKYEQHFWGAPKFHEAVSATPVRSAAPAPTAVPKPSAPLFMPKVSPSLQRGSVAPKATPTAAGWDDLIDLFDAPPPAAAALAPAPAAPTQATLAAPVVARATGGSTTADELLRLFDPLPPLSQPPSKPIVANPNANDAFFATFGL